MEANGIIRFRLQQIWVFLKQFIIHCQQNLIGNRCLESAAALTLASLFALVPILAVVYRILSVMPALAGLGDQVQSWLLEYWVPHDEFDIQSYLTQFRDQTSRLTAIGATMLLMTALLMLKRIEQAFNRIWQVDEPRRGVMSFVRYWAILSLGPLLFLAGLVTTSYLFSMEFLSPTVQSLNDNYWRLQLLPILTSWLGFSLLNLVVPNCKVPVKSAILGGLFSSLAFEAAKRAFGAFVSYFPSYELVYGAFAVLPLFIIWLYLSWLIVLMGGVMARALTLVDTLVDVSVLHSSQGRQQISGLQWLSVLHFFWSAQQSNQVVSELQAARALRAIVSQSQWEHVCHRLLKIGYLQKTQYGDFLLTGDLAQMTVIAYLRDVEALSDFKWVAIDDQQQWQLAVSRIMQDQAESLENRLSMDLSTLFRSL